MASRDGPRRQGPVRRPPARSPRDDLAAVADVLLSGTSGQGAPAADRAWPTVAPTGLVVAEPPIASSLVPDGPAGQEGPEPTAAPPRGLYVLVPAGVDPSRRRDASLEAARRLAASHRPAAVLFLENGRVDAHVVGETASGRLGPQNDLGAADLDRALRELAGRCDPIALVPVDASADRVERVGPAIDRPVFLLAADEEGLLETYRTLKGWRRAGAAAEAAVLYDAGGNGRATVLHRRLRRAAEDFLGCDLALQQTPSDGRPAAARPGVRLFAGIAAEAVWGPLLAVLTGTRPAVADTAARVTGTERPAEAAEAAGGLPAVCPAFGLWRPESREALLRAVESQLPTLLDETLREALRPGVDEPGAPPLVAVRHDGTLVAVLFGEPDTCVPTREAEQWLRVHWPLLVRACPGAAVGTEPAVASVVLVPARSQEAASAVRRFVPVRLGGHKGIVLLP